MFLYCCQILILCIILLVALPLRQRVNGISGGLFEINPNTPSPDKTKKEKTRDQKIRPKLRLFAKKCQLKFLSRIICSGKVQQNN